jgi:putative redox protein
MPNELSAKVTLQEKVQFAGQDRSQPPLTLDYSPRLGEGTGLMPLELLLLSLAGCSGHAVIGILRWMEQPVVSLEVQAWGQRRDEYPAIFTSIELEFAVHGADIDPELVVRAIALAEERYCPVWAMLQAGTKITSSFRIIETIPVYHPEH